MKTEHIYIVFSKTGTWLSRSIGVVTGSDYTHVSLSLDSSFETMYSFGRLNPNNPFIGGLAIENLYTGVYRNSPCCQCLIYKVPVTKNQLALLKYELNSHLVMNEKVKYRYNFIGLFAVLMDKPLKRDRHFFCSEFVSTLLSKSDIWHSPKVPELTRPTDLIEITDKEIVYEGLLTGLYNLNTVEIAL